eukprot:gene8029-1435_t
MAIEARMMRKTSALTALCHYALSAADLPPMVPITVPEATCEKFGARCLGGDAPSYQIRRNASSNKWVLYLEGGGWCYGATEQATIASCAGRAGFKPPAGMSA